MWNNDKGEFIRYVSAFSQSIRSDGSSPFTPEPNRYHLYISWACPWAHRVAIVRSLLGLEDMISMSVVDPVWNESGWTFTSGPNCVPDFVNGKKNLIDVYRLANPQYEGEETTPVLWDKKLSTLVNNESLDIIKMLATEFNTMIENGVDLYPLPLLGKIDRIIDSIYPTINNGVYRAGFASSQPAYEKACNELFFALSYWEKELSNRRYLCGDHLTLADICLFTTLFRFDLIYYGHFKCNLKHLYEFPNLWGFVRDVYQTANVASTCHIDHIKRHYYMSQTDINPTKIVPLGPNLDFMQPHSRANGHLWS